MVLRKNDLMYRQFGKTDGKICKDCSNLLVHCYDKKYYKCSVYGISNSEATDWRLKYQACGMFNKEWNGNDIVRLVKPSGVEKEPEKPLDGQMNIWGC